MLEEMVWPNKETEGPWQSCVFVDGNTVPFWSIQHSHVTKACVQ
jgi:hypothetical protein